MVRVVRPGGVLLVDLGGHPAAARPVHQHFAAEAGMTRPRIGLAQHETGLLDGSLAAAGARLRKLPVVTERVPTAVGTLLDVIESNQFSWTWTLDEATRARAAATTREWARAEFGSLEHVLPVTTEIAWRAYDLP
jgi:hypothetical protein